MRVISNELILAGKLQLKKLQKKKPEKNSGTQYKFIYIQNHNRARHLDIPGLSWHRFYPFNSFVNYLILALIEKIYKTLEKMLFHLISKPFFLTCTPSFSVSIITIMVTMTLSSDAPGLSF